MKHITKARLMCDKKRKKRCPKCQTFMEANYLGQISHNIVIWHFYCRNCKYEVTREFKPKKKVE